MVGGAAERWQSENTDLGFGFVYCRGARAHVAAPQSYRHRRRWRLSHESLRLADHSITKSAQPYSSALRQRMLRGLRRNTNGVPYHRRRRARQGRRLSARFVGQNASGVPCRIYRSLETQRFDFDRRQSRARATPGPSSATPRRDRKQISVHALFGANRKEGHLKSGLRFEAVNPFTERKKIETMVGLARHAPSGLRRTFPEGSSARMFGARDSIVAREAEPVPLIRVLSDGILEVARIKSGGRLDAFRKVFHPHRFEFGANGKNERSVRAPSGEHRQGHSPGAYGQGSGPAPSRRGLTHQINHPA